MARLSLHKRRLIVTLYTRGYTQSKIQKELYNLEGVFFSLNTIGLWIQRYKQGKLLEDLPRRHVPCKLLEAHFQFIDQCMNENSETTATEIRHRLIDQFRLGVSTATITSARRKLGWVYTGTAYCQLIRDVNKVKRLEYCERCISTHESFDNVIFTDETKIQLESAVSRSSRKKGMPRKLKAKPKHPYTVYAWAGISKRGATAITLFTGIMDSQFYQKILDTNLRPFTQRKFPDGHRLFQDNDPKHTSRATKSWIEDNGINWWPTPPESPDLNPIELIWAHLKWYIRRHVKPRTKNDLLRGIKEYWNKTVTPSFCRRYIDHLHKVIPEVIVQRGAASGY